MEENIFKSLLLFYLHIQFFFYNQRDLGITFLLTLIKNQKGPIHKIGCIPLYALCVYKNNSGKYYTLENKIIYPFLKVSCDKNKDYYNGGSETYASIVILNAPLNRGSNRKGPILLLPPNLKDTILKCEHADKFMVVSDLTLLDTEDFRRTSHSNVIIFDIRRKTIERFDPHGGNYYSNVGLAYDPENLKTNRKDFKFGKVEKQKIKIRSDALFNQEIIDRILNTEFKKILPEYTFYGTNITTPYLGPQVKVDEFDGLCVTWSCMYMILRLLNPDLSPADVTVKMIDGTPQQLRNRILRFQKFIIRTLQKTKKDLKNEIN